MSDERKFGLYTRNRDGVVVETRPVGAGRPPKIGDGDFLMVKAITAKTWNHYHWDVFLDTHTFIEEPGVASPEGGNET